MKKTIIILGNSQLSFFVAKQLSDIYGNLVHMDIVWLTNTSKLSPVACKTFSIKTKLQNVAIKTANIKSVNLGDRRIITGSKTYEYDLLFIDQTPVFNSKEREKINDQFETLISTVRSKENRGISAKTKIFLEGDTADTRQLALYFSDRKLKDSSNSVSTIRVETDAYKGKMLEFFKESNVFSRKSQYPGITVKSPRTIFPTKKMRGLGVDMEGYAMLLATGEPASHQNVIMIDNHERKMQNIARSDWGLAKQIVHNIDAKLEGGLEKPLDYTGDKLLLSSKRGYFVKLGEMVSSRNRARAVFALEKRFWSKLFNR